MCFSELCNDSLGDSVGVLGFRHGGWFSIKLSRFHIILVSGHFRLVCSLLSAFSELRLQLVYRVHEGMQDAKIFITCPS